MSGFFIRISLGSKAPLETLYKSQIERYKYQDNSHVHRQPCPKEVPEEQGVYADYDGYHQHNG